MARANRKAPIDDEAEAYLKLHKEMLMAFTAFLEGHWPNWRDHTNSERHCDMQAAFIAGWRSA